LGKAGGILENIKSNQNQKAQKGLFFLIFIPCLLISQALDNDVWFLLNSGRYVLHNGFPVTEPFTVHEGLSFVMQQWLTSSLFWTVYAKLGVFGLFALVMIFYCLIVFILYKISMLVSENNFIVSYGITMLTGALITPFMVTRPYIISTLLIVLEIFCLESYIIRGKKEYLYILPVLSALEINFHAAMWPMLFVILIPYWIDAFKFRFLFIKGQGYPKISFLIVSILMFAAGFANPYGFDAMTYLFKSYGYPEISYMVQEMLPADINVGFGKWIFGTLLAVTLTYILYKKGNTKLRYVLLTLGTAFLALSSMRGFLFFSICGLFPLSYFLREAKIKEKTPSSPKRQVLIRILLIAAVCAALVFGLADKYQKSVRFASKPDGADAVGYLLEHADPDTAVVYTSYDVGGYAEYMGFRCYIDPRAEVFVKNNNGKKDIMREYYDLQRGRIYYQDFLSRYDFTHLLVPKGDVLYTCLPHDAGYKLIYEDADYRLFERLANQS